MTATAVAAPRVSSRTHRNSSSEDGNAKTYFVEGSTASQDYVRVLNLDSPLTQPDKVSPNSNCPTGNLKKRERKRKKTLSQ